MNPLLCCVKPGLSQLLCTDLIVHCTLCIVRLCCVMVRAVWFEFALLGSRRCGRPSFHKSYLQLSYCVSLPAAVNLVECRFCIDGPLFNDLVCISVLKVKIVRTVWFENQTIVHLWKVNVQMVCLDGHSLRDVALLQCRICTARHGASGAGTVRHFCTTQVRPRAHK